MSTLYEQLAARLGPKGYATDAETLAPYPERVARTLSGRDALPRNARFDRRSV